MARSLARLLRIGVLGMAVLAVLACGLSTSVGVVGGTSAPMVATATHTPLPTTTPQPTATPTPGHLLVTVNPLCQTSQSCGPYVCHNGTTCTEHGICTASAWPTFALSNIGQVALTWHGTINGNGIPTTGWTLSASSGTLAGGGSTTVSVNDDPTQIGLTNPSIVFTGPGQTVTITLSCGIG